MVKLLPMSILIGKAYQYIQEINLCLKVGANLGSRFGLVAATLQFHAANALGNGHSSQILPKRYHVRLGHNLTDLWMRTYSGDLFVFHEVFLSRCYCIPETWLDKVSIIVALGANIGLTTLFFTQYFPIARYVCVEPNTSNVDILKKNVSHLNDSVSVVEGAVSDCSGEFSFDDSGQGWEGHLSSDNHSGKLVRCYSMEEIMLNYDLSRIDILKVDIEGAEKKLFSNNNEWIKKLKMIIAKIHEIYSNQDFEEDLLNYGFKVFPPTPEYGNRMLVALSPDLAEAVR